MSYDEHDTAVRGLLRRVSVVDVDDTGTQQRLKLSGLKGEELDQVVRSQHYGLSSVPPKGGEGVLLLGGGRSDRAQVLGLEHPEHRPKDGKPGEVVLYDDQKQKVYLSRDGILIDGGANNLPLQINIGGTQLKISENEVRIKCAKIVLEGDVYLGGDDADKPAAMEGSIDSGGDVETSNLATKVFVK